MKTATGFTLIELLIVVAIIGILAIVIGQACTGSDPEITHQRR